MVTRRWLRGIAAGPGGRATNIALLWLLLLSVLTGAVSFALGTGWVAWPTVAHGVVGIAVVLLSGWKWRIARRGLERRPATSTWPSVLFGVLVVVALVSGVLHATGLVLRYGPLDDMQVHVGAAMLSLPLLAWHTVARSTVPGRQDLTRRNLVRSALLIGSAGAVWAAAEAAVAAAGLRGVERRSTGSFEEASHQPHLMPSIIWLFDPRLDLSAGDWSLTVVNGEARHLGLSELDGGRTGRASGSPPDDANAMVGARRGRATPPVRLTTVTAVLDCTSGWWSEQDWTGVSLAALLGPVPPEARSVVVTSATGYARRFPVRDLDTLLLATRYAGRPLATRHGFPARLVAPGRRGFWWVKWVARIEVSDVPWWRQPPYPLQ